MKQFYLMSLIIVMSLCGANTAMAAQSPPLDVVIPATTPPVADTATGELPARRYVPTGATPLPPTDATIPTASPGPVSNAPEPPTPPMPPVPPAAGTCRVGTCATYTTKKCRPRKLGCRRGLFSRCR